MNNKRCLLLTFAISIAFFIFNIQGVLSLSYSTTYPKSYDFSNAQSAQAAGWTCLYPQESCSWSSEAPMPQTNLISCTSDKAYGVVTTHPISKEKPQEVFVNFSLIYTPDCTYKINYAFGSNSQGDCGCTGSDYLASVSYTAPNNTEYFAVNDRITPLVEGRVTGSKDITETIAKNGGGIWQIKFRDKAGGNKEWCSEFAYIDYLNIEETCQITSNITSATDKSVAAMVNLLPLNLNVPLNFGKNEIGISEISIASKNKLTSVGITINEMEEAESISSVSGKLYRYISVDKTNIQNTDISKVKIKFQVKKSWIDSNYIDVSKIALNQYENNQWNKLPTTKTNEDASYIYYEADSTGLSLFAISGEMLSCPTCPSPSTWLDCVDNKQTRENYKCSMETKYQCQVYTESQQCGLQLSQNILYIFVVIVITVVFVVFRKKMFKKKENKLKIQEK